MVCNAVYAVSRAYRLILQAPNSPWALPKVSDQPIPEIHFLATSPVFFDRHTLSIKRGRFSMFTLDGRMKFEAALSDEDESRFMQERLREVALLRSAGGYQLSVRFVEFGEVNGEDDHLPNYVVVTPDSSVPLATSPLHGSTHGTGPTLPANS